MPEERPSLQTKRLSKHFIEKLPTPSKQPMNKYAGQLEEHSLLFFVRFQS